MKLNIPTMEEEYVAFEICGELCKISEYDNAIKEKNGILNAYHEELKEFPYTVRKLTNDNVEKFREAPLYILYRDQKISFYQFLRDNRAFERQLPLSKATNGLEVDNDLELSVRHFKDNDDFHAVIYETFRVLQDLHYLISTARWALIQAHRILHFRSGLKWNNGWEQLWTRATWLNNAIVMYDSCLDKIIQAVWIGTEGYSHKIGLSRTSLYHIYDIENVYKGCWRRDDIPKKMPEPFKTLLTKFRNQKNVNRIPDYAQKIKHRGGMRYDGLFPFGQIAIVDDGYDPYTTRNTQDIDVIVTELKDYHIALVELADSVTENLKAVFRQHGYLTGEDIVF